MREADPPRAREMADQALDAIGDSDPAARFDALRVAWNAAYWVGHLSDAEHYLTEQLAIARAAGRKDLESIAVLTRADTFWARLELDEARALLQEARELAEESGTINSRGRVLLSWAKVYLLLGHLEQAERSGRGSDPALLRGRRRLGDRPARSTSARGSRGRAAISRRARSSSASRFAC